MLGVDTAVVLDGARLGKPARRGGGARRCSSALAGRTHEVVSGLCLRTPAWEELRTRGDARDVPPARRRATSRAYVASGEWEGRAGAYAIQGCGARLVERIEGDYLNVVGLPAALLVRLLAERFPGTYGFG